jgi:flagellin-like hook-associated protein FlgL
LSHVIETISSQKQFQGLCLGMSILQFFDGAVDLVRNFAKWIKQKAIKSASEKNDTVQRIA